MVYFYFASKNHISTSFSFFLLFLFLSYFETEYLSFSLFVECSIFFCSIGTLAMMFGVKRPASATCTWDNVLRFLFLGQGEAAVVWARIAQKKTRFGDGRNRDMGQIMSLLHGSFKVDFRGWGHRKGWRGLDGDWNGIVLPKEWEYAWRVQSRNRGQYSVLCPREGSELSARDFGAVEMVNLPWRKQCYGLIVLKRSSTYMHWCFWMTGCRNTSSVGWSKKLLYSSSTRCLVDDYGVECRHIGRWTVKLSYYSAVLFSLHQWQTGVLRLFADWTTACSAVAWSEISLKWLFGDDRRCGLL